MNNNVVYAVLDKEGFGWEPSYGKKTSPDIFPSLELADEYIEQVHVKFPEAELIAIPLSGEKLLNL